MTTIKYLPDLTTNQSIVLEAICYNGGSALPFHGGKDAEIDIKSRIFNGLGYSIELDEIYQAGHDLVNLGLAYFHGNQWLTVTPSGLSLYDSVDF